MNPTPVLVRVPEGATHLFLSVGDGQFFDNTLTDTADLPNGPDGGPLGEFGVRIATVSDGRFVGDADNDGSTSGNDFLGWQRQFGQTGLTLSADFDFNAKVDGDDGSIWEQNFGSVSSLTTSATVPEPSTGIILMLGIAAAMLIGRRTAISNSSTCETRQ